MSKKIDKEKIAKEICKAAKLYKEHLVGKRFAYVFDARFKELPEKLLKVIDKTLIEKEE